MRSDVGLHVQVQAAVNDKPEYHTLVASVALIDTNQAFYYCANPDNNKKVCPMPNRLQ